MKGSKGVSKAGSYPAREARRLSGLRRGAPSVKGAVDGIRVCAQRERPARGAATIKNPECAIGYVIFCCPECGRCCFLGIGAVDGAIGPIVFV